MSAVLVYLWVVAVRLLDLHVSLERCVVCLPFYMRGIVGTIKLAV